VSPVSEPQIHDYTSSTRAIDHDTIFTPMTGGMAMVGGWGAGVRQGDFLLLDGSGPTVRYRVEEIRYDGDLMCSWHAVVSELSEVAR